MDKPSKNQKEKELDIDLFKDYANEISKILPHSEEIQEKLKADSRWWSDGTRSVTEICSIGDYPKKYYVVQFIPEK